MPSAATTVGPLVLPLVADVADLVIDDPTVTGLLAYLGFWLRNQLNAKLATVVGTSADACPVANRYPWDPGVHFVRGDGDGVSPFPGLWVWRQGLSRRVPYSTMHTIRESKIGVLWAFDELLIPAALVDRHGLRAAVDAVFHVAADWGYHPNYGHDTDPDGTALAFSLGLAGPGFSYDGGEAGIMKPVPASYADQISGGDSPTISGYPTLKGTFTVWEAIDQPKLADPGDVAQDIATTIRVNGDGDATDPLTIMNRYLPAAPTEGDT